MNNPTAENVRKEALWQIVSHLSETIGERHLGSTGEAATQDFLEARFREMGYEVLRETFDTPGWRYGKYEMRLENGETLDCAPCYFSPGTTLTAKLQTFWTATDAAGPLEKFAGSIVFAGNYDFMQVADTNALAERLEKAGAAALIINSPYNDTYSTKIIRSPHLERMAVFTVSQRTALRLAREEGRPVSLHLEAQRFDHVSCNVVARHHSSQKGADKLVIGAHYDTSPGIPGAADNATGIASLLEIARACRDKLSNWNVDFVAFGGEEYGGPGYGIGGYKYAQAHAAEPIRAMICLDGFGTYLTIPEARVGRSSKLRTLVRKHATRSHLRVLPFRRGSDQGIFHEQGIPTIWLTDGGAENGVRHYPLHSPQDAINLVDFAKLTAMTDDAEAILTALFREGLEEDEGADIEECTPADLEAIARLVRKVWTMGGDCQREAAYGREMGAPWQDLVESSVLEYLQRPDVRAFKISIDHRLAGFTSCRVDARNGLSEIGYNAVDPGFLGAGLGKKLLHFLLSRLHEEGRSEVEVVTGMDPGHAAARSVYESAGFKPFIRSVRYNLRLGDIFPG